MAKENYYELKALELFRQYVGKGLVLNNEESKNLLKISERKLQIFALLFIVNKHRGVL